MRLRFPNQFLCEMCMLGFIAAVGLGKKRELPESAIHEQHPFFFPFLFLSMVMLLQFLIALPEIFSFSYSGIPAQNFLQVLGRNLFLWRIAESPVHPLSVATGYWIQLAFLCVVPSFVKRYRISESTLLQTLMLGSLPVFFYALGQKLTWIPIVASVGIGGTFQNQNSLSFYAGLMLLVAILRAATFYLAHSSSSPAIEGHVGDLPRVKGILIALYASACVYFLFLGQSRISGFGCLCGVGAFFFFDGLLHRGTTGYVKKIWLTFAGLFSLAIFVFLRLKIHETAKFVELRDLLMSGSLQALLEGGGRTVILREGWASAFLHPWTGIGSGYFAMKSTMRDEVHNPILGWIVDVGWSILPIFLYFFLRPLQLLWQERKSLSSTASFFLSLYVYILVTSLFDHYFSYRSLLSVSLFLLLLPFLKISRTHVSSKKSFLLLTAFACLLALTRVPNPQSHPLPTASRDSTPDVSATEGPYRWNGPAFWLDFKQPCFSLSVYPKHMGGTSQLYVGWGSPEERLSNFATFTEYLRFAQASHIELQNGVWSQLCFCQKEGPLRALLLMSDKGEYLTLSEQSPEKRKDYFISYGITEPQFFPDRKSMEETKKCAAGTVQE